jgi:hypothetical protein
MHTCTGAYNGCSRAGSRPEQQPRVRQSRRGQASWRCSGGLLNGGVTGAAASPWQKPCTQSDTQLAWSAPSARLQMYLAPNVAQLNADALQQPQWMRVQKRRRAWATEATARPRFGPGCFLACPSPHSPGGHHGADAKCQEEQGSLHDGWNLQQVRGGAGGGTVGALEPPHPAQPVMAQPNTVQGTTGGIQAPQRGARPVTPASRHSECAGHSLTWAAGSRTGLVILGSGLMIAVATTRAGQAEMGHWGLTAQREQRAPPDPVSLSQVPPCCSTGASSAPCHKSAQLHIPVRLVRPMFETASNEGCKSAAASVWGLSWHLCKTAATIVRSLCLLAVTSLPPSQPSAGHRPWLPLLQHCPCALGTTHVAAAASSRCWQSRGQHLPSPTCNLHQPQQVLTCRGPAPCRGKALPPAGLRLISCMLPPPVYMIFGW